MKTPSAGTTRRNLLRAAALLAIAAPALFLSLSATESLADGCSTASTRCNCVLYARCRVPRLPFGLTSYQDKVRVINSRTPTVGSVAVMNIYPPYGHVAVVEAVHRDGRITVREANYVRCAVTSRTNLPARMAVAGYFRP